MKVLLISSAYIESVVVPISDLVLDDNIDKLYLLKENCMKNDFSSLRNVEIITNIDEITHLDKIYIVNEKNININRILNELQERFSCEILVFTETNYKLAPTTESLIKNKANIQLKYYDALNTENLSHRSTSLLNRHKKPTILILGVGVYNQQFLCEKQILGHLYENKVGVTSYSPMNISDMEIGGEIFSKSSISNIISYVEKLCLNLMNNNSQVLLISLYGDYSKLDDYARFYYSQLIGMLNPEYLLLCMPNNDYDIRGINLFFQSNFGKNIDSLFVSDFMDNIYDNDVCSPVHVYSNPKIVQLDDINIPCFTYRENGLLWENIVNKLTFPEGVSIIQ